MKRGLTINQGRSHDDVKRRLSNLLDDLGFVVRNEVGIKVNATGEQIYVDLLVCNRKGKPLAVVEAKKDPSERCQHQLDRYKRVTGLTVGFCGSWDAVPECVAAFRQKYKP